MLEEASLKVESGPSQCGRSRKREALLSDAIAQRQDTLPSDGVDIKLARAPWRHTGTKAGGCADPGLRMMTADLHRHRVPEARETTNGQAG
jgi:hypothetical protein